MSFSKFNSLVKDAIDERLHLGSSSGSNKDKDKDAAATAANAPTTPPPTAALPAEDQLSRFEELGGKAAAVAYEKASTATTTTTEGEETKEGAKGFNPGVFGREFVSGVLSGATETGDAAAQAGGAAVDSAVGGVKTAADEGAKQVDAVTAAAAMGGAGAVEGVSKAVEEGKVAGVKGVDAGVEGAKSVQDKAGELGKQGEDQLEGIKKKVKKTKITKKVNEDGEEVEVEETDDEEEDDEDEDEDGADGKDREEKGQHDKPLLAGDDEDDSSPLEEQLKLRSEGEAKQVSWLI